MRNDKLIPGTILVLIGLVILLDNFGYIDFHWGNLWHMWPILLIIGGVNLVFAHNRSPLASILKISVVVIGFALLLFGNFSNRWGFPTYYYSWHNHDHDNNDKDDDDDDDDDTVSTGSTNIVKVEGNSNFNLPYDAAAKTAQLNISGAITAYELNDTTSQLFKADTKEHFGKYEFSHHNTGSNYVLDFNLKDHKGDFDWSSDDDKSNKVVFKLNPAPEWDLNIEMGANSLNFDLAKFKIHSLKLSGGAASFDVKLGQPVAENTNVEVSASMASVTLNVPQTAACKIVSDSGLSSTDFDGFTKTSDGNYETPGFDAAKNKIFINISGGLADFNVKRY
jgi:hypothetical protein